MFSLQPMKKGVSKLICNIQFLHRDDNEHFTTCRIIESHRNTREKTSQKEKKKRERERQKKRKKKEEKNKRPYRMLKRVGEKREKKEGRKGKSNFLSLSLALTLSLFLFYSLFPLPLKC